jgi:hypothetical protein
MTLSAADGLNLARQMFKEFAATSAVGCRMNGELVTGPHAGHRWVFFAPLTFDLWNVPGHKVWLMEFYTLDQFLSGKEANVVSYITAQWRMAMISLHARMLRADADHNRVLLAKVITKGGRKDDEEAHRQTGSRPHAPGDGQ